MGEFEARGDRRPQGAVKLARERAEYFRLMDQGLSSSEACRIVGVHLRTGRAWRNGFRAAGRGPVPPVPRPPAGPGAGRPRYLTEDERVQVADLRRAVAGPGSPLPAQPRPRYIPADRAGPTRPLGPATIRRNRSRLRLSLVRLAKTEVGGTVGNG